MYHLAALGLWSELGSLPHQLPDQVMEGHWAATLLDLEFPPVSAPHLVLWSPLVTGQMPEG